ncbi:MAG: glucose-6-phosphate isomerase [Alphaproteobacteria bacterium]
MVVSLKESPAWQALLKHRDDLKAQSLGDLVLQDAARLEMCDVACEGLHFNYAFQRTTSKTIELLVRLAEQQSLDAMRARMFRGDKINATENRAVLHVALRTKNKEALLVDGRNVLEDIQAVHEKMARFTSDVRSGQWKGVTNKPIRHIVNIGIGGSDLGPRLAVNALVSDASNLTTHFVANIDAFDLVSTLKALDPAETLFVVVSKTFTTQETLANARLARQWLTAALGDQAVAQHFVAVSTNAVEVEKFGISPDNIFPMWDWVGGRYSLWSAVGLSVALALGMDHFKKLCDGAAVMDEHFRNAPLDKNIPVLMALLGVWNRNFWDAPALAILSYSERLRDLPRYLQQLDMESNGKSITRDGRTVDYATGPIIFGECGTVGQHSFHQWLHQGFECVPADFIGIVSDDLKQPEHHRALLTNMMAQAGALAFGQQQTTSPFDRYAGNRPSNVITLDKLDPYHLGLLLALYEHKVFTQGVIWNINSFDQPGVELGKAMAKGLEAAAQPQDKSRSFVASFFSKITSISKK